MAVIAGQAEVLHLKAGYCFGQGQDGYWPEWGAARHSGRTASWRGHQGEVLDTIVGLDGQTYTVIRCTPCILNHVIPLPDEATLSTYYREQFYQVSKTDMVARYERDRNWWEFTHRAIIQPMQMMTGLFAPKFFEIGAGTGIALDVAKSLGCRTYGVEPNADLVAMHAAKHHVFAGNWQDLNSPAYQALWPMDIFYLYETLEHLPNPEETLLWCYDHMPPGGVIGIQVPNDYNPFQLAACAHHGLKRWWLAPPEHLTYFTPKTLQLLLRRCGFTVCDIRGTYPLEQFLLDGCVYIGNDTLGRACHQQRMQEEMQGYWPHREAKYRANMTERIGREIVIVGRKPYEESDGLCHRKPPYVVNLR